MTASGHRAWQADRERSACRRDSRRRKPHQGDGPPHRRVAAASRAFLGSIRATRRPVLGQLRRSCRGYDAPSRSTATLLPSLTAGPSTGTRSGLNCGVGGTSAWWPASPVHHTQTDEIDASPLGRRTPADLPTTVNAGGISRWFASSDRALSARSISRTIPGSIIPARSDCSNRKLPAGSRPNSCCTKRGSSFASPSPMSSLCTAPIDTRTRRLLDGLRRRSDSATVSTGVSRRLTKRGAIGRELCDALSAVTVDSSRYQGAERHARYRRASSSHNIGTSVPEVHGRVARRAAAKHRCIWQTLFSGGAAAMQSTSTRLVSCCITW